MIELITKKIWLFSVINWEDGSWWYLPQAAKPSSL